MNEEAKAIGKAIAELLGIEPVRKYTPTGEGLYHTTCGDKTAEGLGLSVERVIEEVKAKFNEDGGA